MQKQLETKTKKWKNAAALAAVLVLVVAFYYFVGCPIRLLTGVPCPGCGMTRAWVALLRLDFAAALWYHPLFCLPPVALWLLLAKGRFAPPIWVKNLLLGLMAAAFVGVYLWRLLVLDVSALRQPAALVPVLGFAGL